MTLSAGQTLGPYEILSPIGEGGMGEVWKARDTRLDRIVAVKVSKQEFSERFEREARAVAALNHPNICQIYDVGPSYLVMEFIEGVPLQGPLAVEKAVEYAAQILDALDAAHRKKLTHRDLKPANILVTRQGIKLLDFGLAKQQAEVVDDPDATLKRLTVRGEILGTLQYMSPEQLHGKEADARSDLFSFGCVLYEMLTGQRAFEGQSAASVIAAILEREPAGLNLTPPLERVIRKCLAKDPDERFQTAKDLKTALLWAVDKTPAAPEAEAVAPPVETRVIRSPAVAWLAAIPLLVLATLAVERAIAPPPPIDLSTLRFTPVATEQSEYVYPGWAPDGRRFGYSLRSSTVSLGPSQVRVQSLGGIATDVLSRGSDSASLAAVGNPMFSPDGSRIFFNFGFSQSYSSVYTVAASGGIPERVLEGRPDARISASDLSPDGKSMVLLVTDQRENTSVVVSSPPGKAWLPLPDSPATDVPLRRAQIKFSPDGKQLLVMYVPWVRTASTQFWLSSLSSSQKPVRVSFELPPMGNEAAFDWMPDSRHIALTPARIEGAPLILGDTLTGKVTPVTANNTHFSNPSVSRRGKVLMTEMLRNHDSVEIPLDGSPIRDLQATARNERMAVWSPSREEYFYVTDRRGASEIWLGVPGRGAHRPIVAREQLDGSDADVTYLSVSPDGERLGLTWSSRLWIVPVSGGVPTPLTPKGILGVRLEWSPDGQWIVYAIAPSARSNIIRVARMGSQENPRDLMEVTQGQLSLWSPDGKWITFESKEGLGVISPDGATKKILVPAPRGGYGALEQGDGLCWALDSQSLYLLRRIEGENVLSSVDVRTGRVNTIRKLDGSLVFGAMYSTRNPMRLSRDGKRLTVTRRSTTTNLWLLEGLELPKPWWRRLW